MQTSLTLLWSPSSSDPGLAHCWAMNGQSLTRMVTESVAPLADSVSPAPHTLSPCTSVLPTSPVNADAVTLCLAH